MSKRKERRERAALLTEVLESSAGSGHDNTPLTAEMLARSPELSGLAPGSARPLMKKFRFQLLHRWIAQQVKPGRVADIGGGKGLLAYLLQQSGWQATVIDPTDQPLPDKYKDLIADRQIKVAPTESVPRRTQIFAPEMAADFDLLLALHAHGCNLQIIDAAATYNRAFLLLPCCVIGEPQAPPPGQHWVAFVAQYAAQRGFAVTPFRLNFKGQNIGLYGPLRGS